MLSPLKFQARWFMNIHLQHTQDFSTLMAAFCFHPFFSVIHDVSQNTSGVRFFAPVIAGVYAGLATITLIGKVFEAAIKGSINIGQSIWKWDSEQLALGLTQIAFEGVYIPIVGIASLFFKPLVLAHDMFMDPVQASRDKMIHIESRIYNYMEMNELS
jgi:hypothetical protein